MRKLSQDQIQAAAREQVAEVPKTAEQLSADALRVHTESMRPRSQVAPDVFPGCDRDVRPRWNGKVVAPLESKIEYL